MGDFNIKEFIEKIQQSEPFFMKTNCTHETLLNNYNYILTKNAEERLNKLFTYISKGIPVLLEGETGSSKTLSAEIICKIIYENNRKNNNIYVNEDEKMFIKYNLSADVKISDLMKKIIGDKTFLSGINIIEGPFFKAFKNGIPLILDEINLAPQEVLQCIEDALDSKVINIDIPSIGFVSQEMKEGFCLIATKNPNQDKYANKRQHLSQSFLSHFQIIRFPPFEIEELEQIVKELFKSFNDGKDGNEKDNQFLLDLINFHKEWTSKENVKNEITCFTIREIAASVKAYIDENKNNAFKIIKTIYSSRYKEKEKNELLNLLGQYKSFNADYNLYKNNGSSFQIPKTINGVYENKAIIEVFESSFFSLDKGRNIIILGNLGSGKSKIARWIAKFYSKSNEDFYHFICTEETKCSDLIGCHSPKKEQDINKTENILEWKEGFLTDSVKNGKIVILDNLQEANSIVTERLNSLLDFKYDDKKGKDRIFDIPENPLESSIKIHKNFRIIGVCNINHIIKMSPAFLNRFDLINLENQIEGMSVKDLSNLIKIILQNEGNNEDDDQLLDELYDNFFGNNLEEENEELNNDIEKRGIDETKNYKFILKEDNLDYLTNKIFNLISNNNIIDENEEKNLLSIKDISKFCKSLKIILNRKEFNGIQEAELIDFIYDLLFTEKEIISNKKIKQILINSFEEYKKKLNKSNNNNNEQFIYKDNETLENFISIVYASFLIHLHLCIIGPTGVGKTSFAKFIARILQGENGFKLFPFHRSTKSRELYGSLNIKEGKIEDYIGPLTESVTKGNIFIADEMNLSSISTMNSLVPILDPLLDKNILVPTIEQPLNIHENFFFIACQNDLDNLGRNIVPENLHKKIKNIRYPTQSDTEIINICIKKRSEIFENNNEFSEIHASYLGKFMINYNELIDNNNYHLLKWSFRDIDKIMKRIFEHIKDENFLNFKYYHFIYFYIYSSIPKSELHKQYYYKNELKTLKEIIHANFIDIFQLNTISNELFNSYFSKPEMDIKQYYIKKGNLGIKFNDLDEALKKGKIH